MLANTTFHVESYALNNKVCVGACACLTNNGYGSGGSLYQHYRP